MKIYEGMIIVNVELGGDKALEHVRALIEKHQGEIIRMEKYAEQRLAYEINKQRRGIYVLVAFRQDPTTVAPIEREFNLDSNVLRSLVLDRSGLTVDKFFRHYNEQEETAEAGAPSR